MILAPPYIYSQTFENRSSLVANPVAGLALDAAVPAPGVTGAALLQPPKSSSVLTFGGPTLAALKPPAPPADIL